MKAEDLKTKTADELTKLLGDLKKQQFNLRFQQAQGQTQNSAQVRAIRRDIARVKTFLGQQQSGQPAAAAKATEKKATKAKSASKAKSGKQAAA